MYWKGICSQAWRNTNAKDPWAIISGAIATFSNYLLQWKANVRTFHSAVICIGIGLVTYAVIVAVQFGLKVFRAIGDDQDSKQNTLKGLLKQSHPELSEKAVRAIAKLESAIQEADTIISHPPTTREVINSWVEGTAYGLARIIGQNSDLFQRFENGVERERIEPQLNREQALLFRRVAVLRDVIDEIKRQRVLVLAF